MFHCPECVAYSLIKRDIPGLKKILNVKLKKYHDIAFLPNTSVLNFFQLHPEIVYDDDDYLNHRNEEIYRDAGGLDPSEENTDIESESDIDVENSDNTEIESESLSENSDEEVNTGEINEDEHANGNQMEVASNEVNFESESNLIESESIGLNVNVLESGRELNEPPGR